MNRHIKTLILFFLVLILSVIYVEKYSKTPDDFLAKPFLSYSVDQIHAFEVHHFIDALRFTKTNNTWTVQKILSKLALSLKEKNGQAIGEVDQEASPAKNLEVTKALTYLTEVKVKEPLSIKKTDPDVFQINPYSLQVILFDQNNNILDTIYIGKQAPEPMSSFIKKNDEQDVYLVDQDFRMLFFRTKDEWIKGDVPIDIESKTTK